MRHGLSPALLLGAALVLAACFDGAQSPPSRPEPPSTEGPAGSMLAPLDLVYVCGNKFLATNSTKGSVQLEYRVVGTGESGSLTLREGPNEDPGFSETELETASTGVVELYHDDVRVARRPNQSVPCGSPTGSASVVAAGNEGTVGKWTAPFPWPIIGL
ncbi:MAG: hypothetical protein K0S19_1998, partial [Geminicoccaceae bacterium]|nr:hypothetical protein [Geminicoccaceae bacterium]